MNGVDVAVCQELFIIVVNGYFPIAFETTVEGRCFLIIASYGGGPRRGPVPIQVAYGPYPCAGVSCHRRHVVTNGDPAATDGRYVDQVAGCILSEYAGRHDHRKIRSNSGPRSHLDSLA